MRLEMAKDLIINLGEPPFDTEGLIGFICGKTGVGKSYTLLKMLEQLFKKRMQFVFLDPHGEGHVLADETFDKHGRVVVISERYGIPVTEEAIPVYIDIIKSGKSVVIDLVKLFKKEKRKFNKFVETFLRQFDTAWSDVRTPITLVMDEAHFFAPQKIRKGDSSAVARVDLITDLATGGRKYGISQIYSTQRPALIDKTPVTQANLRFFGKVTSTQDWNAIKDHVKDTVSFTEIKGFTSGTFVVNIGDDTKVVTIAKRDTKDAGATPTYKASLSSKTQFSMKEITDRIAAVIESARAESEQAKLDADTIRQQDKHIKKLQKDLSEMGIASKAATIVAREMGIKPQAGIVEVDASIAETVESVRRELKRDFDKQLKELANRHQKIVDEKDKVNEEHGNIIAEQSMELILFK